MTAHVFFNFDDVKHPVQKPIVDACFFMNLLYSEAAFKSFSDVKNSVLCRATNEFVKFILCCDTFSFAICNESSATIFKRAHRFPERFFESAPNRHDFSNCLHASRESVIGAFELFKRETRDFYDAVVNRRFKACRRCLRYVVCDFIQCVANSELRSSFRNWKTSRF